MSKLTISVVLTVLELVLKFLIKSINCVKAVFDIVDDGCRNNSAQIPDWMTKLELILEALTNSKDGLDDIVKEVENEF